MADEVNHKNISGDNCLVVTPVPIPNTKVKSQRANGSAGAALCESRSLPGNLFYGQLAQSVEQRTENPRVPGSIPGLATKTQVCT